MFWYILIALILFTIAWILRVPVIIYVNTECNSYSLALPGIFHARLVPASEFFTIRGSVFFIPYHLNPFQNKRNKKKVQKEKSSKKKRPFSASKGLSLARNMGHALRIRKLHLDIDTDDYTLNAWLIPVFSAVNTENIKLQANFEGNASMLLDLRTSIGALIWAFLKSKYNLMSNQ